mgnify:CR=1 FL=1|jgi:hypothetical protein
MYEHYSEGRNLIYKMDWRTLCMFHNSLLNKVQLPNGQRPVLINQIKRRLIELGYCSKYVLHYEGKL